MRINMIMILAIVVGFIVLAVIAGIAASATRKKGKDEDAENTEKSS